MTGHIGSDRHTAARPHLERAPRLRPDQLLADSITRSGRFAEIDPRKGKPLPRIVHVLGVLGWVALAAESFRRARSGDGDVT